MQSTVMLFVYKDILHHHHSLRPHCNYNYATKFGLLFITLFIYLFLFLCCFFVYFAYIFCVVSLVVRFVFVSVFSCSHSSLFVVIHYCCFFSISLRFDCIVSTHERSSVVHDVYVICCICLYCVTAVHYLLFCIYWPSFDSVTFSLYLFAVISAIIICSSCLYSIIVQITLIFVILIHGQNTNRYEQQILIGII